MKKLIIALVCMLGLSITSNSQELNKKFLDPTLESKILIDYCDRTGLENDSEFSEMLSIMYDAYETSEETIKELKAKAKDIEIVMVLGTWCHDSQIQVPAFYKVLDEIGFDEKYLKVIAVNRQKNTVSINIDKLEIKYVPTFIFYKDGKELGRIIESPENTLEADFLRIIG